MRGCQGRVNDIIASCLAGFARVSGRHNQRGFSLRNNMEPARARHTSPKPEPCGKIGGQQGQQQKHEAHFVLNLDMNTSMSSKIVGSKVEVLKLKLDLKRCHGVAEVYARKLLPDLLRDLSAKVRRTKSKLPVD